MLKRTRKTRYTFVNGLIIYSFHLISKKMHPAVVQYIQMNIRMITHDKHNKHNIAWWLKRDHLMKFSLIFEVILLELWLFLNSMCPRMCVFNVDSSVGLTAWQILFCTLLLLLNVSFKCNQLDTFILNTCSPRTTNNTFKVEHKEDPDAEAPEVGSNLFWQKGAVHGSME